MSRQYGTFETVVGGLVIIFMIGTIGTFIVEIIKDFSWTKLAGIPIILIFCLILFSTFIANR